MIAFSALLSIVALTTTSPALTSSSSSWRRGAELVREDVRRIVVVAGADIELRCRVRHVTNNETLLSWLRTDRLAILGAGHYAYTSDHRFVVDNHVVEENEDESESEVWRLRIRDVQLSDDGSYVCQLSTRPVQSNRFIIVVKEARARLLGHNEVFVEVGSNLNLTCLADNLDLAAENDNTLIWSRLDQESLSLSMTTTMTMATLWVDHATMVEEGVYVCRDKRGWIKQPPTVNVHVLRGDRYQSLHTNSGARPRPSRWSSSIVPSLLFSQTGQLVTASFMALLHVLLHV